MSIGTPPAFPPSGIPPEIPLIRPDLHPTRLERDSDSPILPLLPQRDPDSLILLESHPDSYFPPGFPSYLDYTDTYPLFLYRPYLYRYGFNNPLRQPPSRTSIPRRNESGLFYASLPASRPGSRIDYFTFFPLRFHLTYDPLYSTRLLPHLRSDLPTPQLLLFSLS